MHTDICGLFPTATLHGKHYFIVFLDDHTHLIKIQLLATRDQVLDTWKIVSACWENKFGHRVAALQSDNGGEYVGVEFEHYLQEQGVEHRKSVPYAHQQNSCAERAICTLEGCALAVLMQAQLSAGYYGEAVLYIAYLWNLSPSHALPESKMPFKILHNKKPNLSHLHVFGVRCLTCIPIKLHTKNSPHSREAIFLGYPDAVKGWCLHDVCMGTFFNVHDVIFNEGSVLHPCDGSEALRSVPPAPKVSSLLAVSTSLGSGGVISEEPAHLPIVDDTSLGLVLPPSDPVPAKDQPGPCHSAWNHTLTEKGAEYAVEMCHQ